MFLKNYDKNWKLILNYVPKLYRFFTRPLHSTNLYLAIIITLNFFPFPSCLCRIMNFLHNKTKHKTTSEVV